MAKPDAVKPVQRTKHRFICIYGASGVGKTRLIGTTPSQGSRTPIILRPPTDHTDSIRNPDPGLEEWVIKDWDDMNEAMEYLRHDGPRNHNWVWLDSASLYQDHGLDQIWEDLIAEKPHRAKYGLDKPEYGRNMDRLSRWVRAVVAQDQFNFGFTAHPFHADVQGRTLLMPYIQGKNMANKFCGYMNAVAYYEISEIRRGGETVKERVLRFGATDEYYAKDQWDAFTNGRLIQPTMPKILEAIEAARARNRAAQPSRNRTTNKRAAARAKARARARKGS